MRLRDSEEASRAAVQGAGSAEQAKIPQADPMVVAPAVAIEVRECQMLSLDAVAELVEAYRNGDTEQALTRKYEVRRNTVDRHLERAGVAKRPTAKMTPAKVEQATELYGQGLSTNQIGISGSTVWKALKWAGVRMRPPRGVTVECERRGWSRG
ncbi:hypothetical protein [Streptomyces arboris]|uniref:hypothetical protein n=1 Tax=Streptomyces arboris TaxID=2600619 RepID=UPI003636BA62